MRISKKIQKVKRGVNLLIFKCHREMTADPGTSRHDYNPTSNIFLGLFFSFIMTIQENELELITRKIKVIQGKLV